MFVTSRKIPINGPDPAARPAAEDSYEESPQFRVVDRRHFIHEDSAVAESVAAEEKPRYPTYVEELMARVAETERRFKEKVSLIDQEAARTRARLEAENERRLEQSRRELLQPFLEVLDNLERALEAAASGGRREDLFYGVQMTADLFRARLKAQGIEPIEVLGLPFDPNVSQAVGVVAVKDPEKDGRVVEELVRGYRMGDALLREAQVRVGSYSRGPNDAF